MGINVAISFLQQKKVYNKNDIASNIFYNATEINFFKNIRIWKYDYNLFSRYPPSDRDCKFSMLLKFDK